VLRDHVHDIPPICRRGLADLARLIPMDIPRMTASEIPSASRSCASPGAVNPVPTRADLRTLLDHVHQLVCQEDSQH
jgi:hypothetical protein